MKIGDHVHIGANSVVEAATIGNHVVIGKNCIIVSRLSLLTAMPGFTHCQGKFTIIKDCAQVADNTVIPPNTVIPALSLFSGSPGGYISRLCSPYLINIVIGRFIEDLPESMQELVESQTKQYYTRFQPLDR